MPFSKFVMMHAQMYPSGYHQPSHEGICNRFSKLVQIVSTTNSKEVNLQFFFLFYMRNCAIWSKHLWGWDIAGFFFWFAAKYYVVWFNVFFTFFFVYIIIIFFFVNRFVCWTNIKDRLHWVKILMHHTQQLKLQGWTHHGQIVIISQNCINFLTKDMVSKIYTYQVFICKSMCVCVCLCLRVCGCVRRVCFIVVYAWYSVFCTLYIFVAALFYGLKIYVCDNAMFFFMSFMNSEYKIHIMR